MAKSKTAGARKSEKDFRDSERIFRLLVQGVTDYAIYMLDPAGHITNWNAGAERIKGYKAREIVGKHFSIFYTPEDRAVGSSGQGAGHRPQREAFCRRGLARSQGRLAVPCLRGDRPDLRETTAHRLRQNHPRHQRTPASLGGPRRQRKSVQDAGGRRHRLCALYAEPHRRHFQLERRRSAHQGLSPRRDHRTEFLDVSIRRRTAPRASPRAPSGSPSKPATTRKRAGACARTVPSSGPASSSTRSATTTAS